MTFVVKYRYLLLCLLVGSVFSASAQGISGKIRGQVVFEKRHFRGVVVKLLNELDDSIASATTDALGYFEFSELQPGVYQVQIDSTRDYYATLEEFAVVLELVYIKLSLERKSAEADERRKTPVVQHKLRRIK
jgi:hypothetical protein